MTKRGTVNVRIKRSTKKMINQFVPGDTFPAKLDLLAKRNFKDFDEFFNGKKENKKSKKKPLI